MNSISRKKILMVAMSLMVVGCDSVAQYSGDGKLVDNGPSAASDRYVLDLGPVSLKTAASATFKLENLPKENFVIGIALRVPEGSSVNQNLITPAVSLALLEDGKALVTKEAQLNAWTWSVHSTGNYAFVYGRGQPGTYFTPTAGKRYELVFGVTEPDRGNENYTAALVVKSGGWK